MGYNLRSKNQNNSQVVKFTVGIDGDQNISWSESNPSNYLLFTQIKLVTKAEQSLFKINIINRGQTDLVCFQIGYPEKDTYHYCSAPAQRVRPESNHVELTGKSKMSGIL